MKRDFRLCRNALRRNACVHKIDGILRDDDEILPPTDFENVGDGARVFLLALHQQLFLIFLDTNKHRFFDGLQPVIHHDRLVLFQ